MDRVVHAVALAHPLDSSCEDLEHLKHYPVTPALPACATAWRRKDQPGRRTIFANLQRATRYIVAVHVPIAGLAMLPLLLGCR